MNLYLLIQYNYFTLLYRLSKVAHAYSMIFSFSEFWFINYIWSADLHFERWRMADQVMLTVLLLGMISKYSMNLDWSTFSFILTSCFFQAHFNHWCWHCVIYIILMCFFTQVLWLRSIQVSWSLDLFLLLIICWHKAA